MAHLSINADSDVYFLNCQDCGCDTVGGEAFCNGCKQARIGNPSHPPVVVEVDELPELVITHCHNCLVGCDYFLCDDCTYSIMVNGDDHVVSYFESVLRNVRRYLRS